MTLTTKELEDIIENSLSEEAEKVINQLKSGTPPKDVELWALNVTFANQIEQKLRAMVLRLLTQDLVMFGSLPDPLTVLKLGFMSGLVAGKAIGEAEALKTQFGNE